MTLSIVAIIYTSLVALLKLILKNYCLFICCSYGYGYYWNIFVNHQGLEGAMMQMISHGLVSAALFLCVGVIYDRMHTSDINFYGGLVNIMPNIL